MCKAIGPVQSGHTLHLHPGQPPCSPHVHHCLSRPQHLQRKLGTTQQPSEQEHQTGAAGTASHSHGEQQELPRGNTGNGRILLKKEKSRSNRSPTDDPLAKETQPPLRQIGAPKPPHLAFNTLGFECTLEELDLEDITENQINTIKACTAEHSGAFNTLGFECTLEELDLEDITENQINTIKACTAEHSGTGNCPALERSTFDTNKCLQGIYEDLKAYRAELKNFNNQKVLTTIDEMMKGLRFSSTSVLQPSSNTGSTFKDRMRLCSVLHAFRIRAVTINRMMNYLTSPESSL
nr:PREDICTED: interleukin-12 subunit alpha [Apteryx mantelli mantelli]